MAVYGARLHVVVDLNLAQVRNLREVEDAIRRALAEGGATVGAVGRIEPPLEDVFVWVVGGRATAKPIGLRPRSSARG